jgi:hypothetical protein
MTAAQTFRVSRIIHPKNRVGHARAIVAGAIVAGALSLIACVRVGGPEGSSGQRSSADCKDTAECEKQYEEAKARVETCQSDCTEIQRDYNVAARALQTAMDREREQSAAKDRQEKSPATAVAESAPEANASTREKRREDLRSKVRGGGCAPQSELDELGPKWQVLHDSQRVDCEQFYDCRTLQSFQVTMRAGISNCKHEHKEAASNARYPIVTSMSQEAVYIVPALSLAICRDEEILAKMRAGSPVVIRKSKDYMVKDVREYRAAIKEKWKSSPVACSELKVLNQCVEDETTCSNDQLLMRDLYWRTQAPGGL